MRSRDELFNGANNVQPTGFKPRVFWQAGAIVVDDFQSRQQRLADLLVALRRFIEFIFDQNLSAEYVRCVFV